MATSREPSFTRVIFPGDPTDGGVGATYNASEAAAWVTAIASAAPTGSTDAAEATYLATCLTAARTALYTPGTQTGGVGPYNSTANGVGQSILNRLIALGTNDLNQ